MDGRAPPLTLHCHHFDADRCRSCTLLPLGYDEQVASKVAHAASLLDPSVSWLPPVTGPASAFRNKAKMVVSGTVAAPVLGILGPSSAGVDLVDCPLHEPAIQAALPVLRSFVTQAALSPYDVTARAGELKHLLVTASPTGALMVRFVMRSTEALSRLQKHLPALLASLPSLRVVSLNVQPSHAAILEGPREIVLTPASALPMPVNDVTLALRPQSFFQTNTTVAAALYAQAAAWIADLAPASVWDLYCGVGGFALHAAAPGRSVVGVEISEEAVASATSSAAGRAIFLAADALSYATSAAAVPDLVIVNPPRRGLGPDLSAWLAASGVRDVVYSSCNSQSLARDLALMPSLRPVQARLFDMFPQSDHYEVLVRLSRSGARRSR